MLVGWPVQVRLARSQRAEAAPLDRTSLTRSWPLAAGWAGGFRIAGHLRLEPKVADNTTSCINKSDCLSVFTIHDGQRNIYVRSGYTTTGISTHPTSLLWMWACCYIHTPASLPFLPTTLYHIQKHNRPPPLSRSSFKRTPREIVGNHDLRA